MSDCGFCQRIRDWLAKPYDDDGDVFNWFLFIGLIAVIGWLWSRILRSILK